VTSNHDSFQCGMFDSEIVASYFEQQTSLCLD